MTTQTIATFTFLVFSYMDTTAEHTVESPDSKISAVISTNKSGQLQYRLTCKDTTVMENAPLGVIVDEVNLGQGVVIDESPERSRLYEIYSWRGVHSEAVDHYNSATFSLIHEESETQYSLEVHVFDDGFGFRYIIPGEGVRTVSGETTDFRIPAGSQVWFQTNTQNYEAEHKKYELADISENTFIGPPMTIVLPDDKGYAAITEAALYNYSGMTLRAEGNGSQNFHAAFQDDKSWELEGTITTPWRAVIVSSDLNGLVNSDIIPNLCPPVLHELAHADWIRPGRALWSWWSQGTGNLELNKEYVEKASELGFEYNLVDAGWEKWEEGEQSKWDLISELVDYAKQRDVDIWVWKHYSGIMDKKSRQDFFQNCCEAGVVGMKIDFMDSESKEMIDFYEAVLKEAAELELMINFHGANKPTGESRTWPNEMTREGIKGLEYRNLPPAHYASLPFTRFLAGHGDFTPCTLDLGKLHDTTFALQLASTIVFTSPLTHWADTPHFYLDSSALDVIKQIPTAWNETHVLPGSEIGKLAAFARQKEDTWFVGIINGAGPRQYELELSFLGEGEYQAILLADNPEKPDDFIRSEKKIEAVEQIAYVKVKRTALSVEMNEGGGFVAMFTPSPD